MTDAARATARPRIRPSAEPAPRHIEVVATRGQRRARPRTVYAVIVVGGLFVVLLAQLLLSIGLSDGAYAIQSLQQQQRELERTHQALTEDVDRLSSPQNLARNAQALGMVASASPSFLSLDGSIQGTPQAKGEATTALTADTLIGNSLLSGVPLTITGDPAAKAAAVHAATTPEGGAAVDPGSAIPGSAEAAGGVTAGSPSAPPAAGAAAGLASATAIPTPQTR
jgi:hypothetical protein